MASSLAQVVVSPAPARTGSIGGRGPDRFSVSSVGSFLQKPRDLFVLFSFIRVLFVKCAVFSWLNKRIAILRDPSAVQKKKKKKEFDPAAR